MAKMTPDMITPEVEARFWAKVDRRGPDECWPWTGNLCRDGYGFFSAHNISRKAHRWSFVVSGQEIPPTFVVDHVCRNRVCVNPAHLRAVSAYVNSMVNSEALPARNAKKTHCLRGHELRGDNLIDDVLRRTGHRICKTCQMASALKWRNKVKAERDHLKGNPNGN
jgi:hypothetical protein